MREETLLLLLIMQQEFHGPPRHYESFASFNYLIMPSPRGGNEGVVAAALPPEGVDWTQSLPLLFSLKKSRPMALQSVPALLSQSSLASSEDALSEFSV